MNNLNVEKRLKEINLMYKKSNKYMLYINLEDIGFLLDLIKNQQKEIKQLKSDYDELFEKYEMKKILFVRKDHNTQELLSELYIRKDTLNNDYISKDKIKNKIKDLELKKSFSDDFTEEFYLTQIDLLQELLGREN